VQEQKLTRAEFDRLASQPDRLLLIAVRRPDELSSVGGFPVYADEDCTAERHIALASLRPFMRVSENRLPCWLRQLRTSSSSSVMRSG